MADRYWLSSPAGSTQPYVYHAEESYVQGGGKKPPPVGVLLGEVFESTPASEPSSPPFSLTTQPSPFSHQVKVEESVWQFEESPIRTKVREAFDTFLTQLDGLKLKGGRLHQIRNWLAQALPQTFAESLYFRYGFDPSRRCVELSPGMRLRVEFQTHQAVDPGNTPLNGFVGGGGTSIEVRQTIGVTGKMVLGFDPFLSRLLGLSAGTATAGGGAIDLQSPALQMPYWRLHYPETYPASGSTGAEGTRQNAVLVGAPTRLDLEAASTRYEQDGTVPAPAVGAWFRGRATPIPEIPVLFQGATHWCTLGTTLRDLVAGFAPAPWEGKAKVPSQFFSRLLTLPAPGKEFRWSPVEPYARFELEASYYQYGPTLDSFDLPLLGGDSIGFPVTAS